MFKEGMGKGYHFSRKKGYGYRKIPKISPGAYIFQRPLLRGLCKVENLCFKIDWASLQLEANLPVLLCFILYLRAISKYKPPGALYSEGRFHGTFFVLRVWGAYIWRG